jgi:hypothetical protein
MGAGQSIPSTLTRQKVFDLTRDTRGMMDVLLDYMLKELTVRDFLALSNPTECKKYVIFLANTLYKHFYELQIEPTKDKKGIIAFRPVKDLVAPTKEDESEKQTLCLTLAYFYTRIFQIYGALALTVLDDAKFMTDSGLLPTTQEGLTKTLQPPGYRTFITSGGAQPDSRRLMDFAFLRSFLADEAFYPPTSQGFMTTYGELEDSKDEVRFLPGTKEGTGQKGLFNIGLKGAPLSQYNKLVVVTSVKGAVRGEDRTLTFGKLTYYKKDGTTDTVDLDTDVLIKRTIQIEQKAQIRPGQPTQYFIKESEKTISQYFNEVLGNVVAYIRKAREGDVSTYTSSSGIIIDEKGVAEELKLAKIVQNLTRIKPMGHCVARAMQLLKTYPIPDRDSVSYICKAKFFEQTIQTPTGEKKEYSRSGIPEPGDPIDKSPGLAALSQLFYDTILATTPKIVIGTKPYGPDKKSSEQRYMEFMKKMGTFFGDQPFTGTQNEDTVKAALKKGLSGIINKRDQEICKGLPQTLTVPKADTKSVYQVVNALFQIQVRHAAECGKIVKLLFDISRDKSSGLYRISLSNNIIKKGFAEIERINYLARDVLVKYYENCERTYLSGVQIVMNKSPEVKEIRKFKLPDPPSGKPRVAPS